MKRTSRLRNRIFLVLAVLLVLCVGSFDASALSAAPQIAYARIPVSQTILYPSGETADEAIVFYTLTADAEKDPLPEGAADGSFVFSLTGSSSFVLEIAYFDVGIFSYTLSALPAEEEGVQADEDVYTILVYILRDESGSLSVAVSVWDEAGSKKQTQASFAVTAEAEDEAAAADGEKETKGEEGGGETKKAKKGASITAAGGDIGLQSLTAQVKKGVNDWMDMVKTSDFGLWWLLVLIVIVGIALIAFVLIRNRKKK